MNGIHTKEIHTYFTDKQTDRKKTESLSFHSYIKSEEVIHKGTIKSGALNLKDRLKTLDESVKDLTKAQSKSERFKRASITALYITSIAVLSVAVATFAFTLSTPAALMGAIGLPLSSVALIGLLMIGDMVLQEKIYGSLPDLPILFPITLPLNLISYHASYESKRAAKVNNQKRELKEIATYVVENKDKIHQWLKKGLKSCKKHLPQEKVKINNTLSTNELNSIMHRINKIEYHIKEIEKHQNLLEESYKIAQEVLA